MARTPNNTQGQDFVVLPTDEIRGEDAAPASGDPGGTLVVRGGAGDGAGVGGNISLTPGTGSTPGTLTLNYTVWPAADGSNKEILRTNGAGVLTWVSGMQEIPLTVATVNMDPGPDSTTNPIPAEGLPGGAIGVTRGENSNSRIQYLEFAKSTEDDIGMSWNIVLPTTYSGNGLTVEFWVSSDSVGSPSAAASFTGAFERQNVPFNLDASAWGAAQAATGTTLPLTPWNTVKGTITFTNIQIDGLLAGEPARFALMRLQSDAYAGEVRFVHGRIYETP